MKKLVLILILLIACAVFLLAFQKSRSVWHLPGKDIHLIIADTPGTWELGLGGRSGLSEDSAMLFVFAKSDVHIFWMKDMKFPIDIIWLDESYRIIHIESDLSPSTYPQTFKPDQNSLYVLETAALFSQKNNLKVGDVLDIDLLK